MRTNGCVYGDEYHCGKHGTPWKTDKHVRQGTICRTLKYGGAMRKHGGERQVCQDPERAQLDALASRRVVYGGCGVIIRRKAV